MRIRRAVSVLLILLMLSAVAVPAAAENDFDFSKFNLADYILEMQDDGDYGFVLPNTYCTPLREFAKIHDITLSSSTYFSYTYPYVYIARRNNNVVEASYMMLFQLANDVHPQLNVHTMEFIINGQSYVFSIPDDHRSNGVKDNDSTYYENIYIYIGEDNCIMLDELAALQAPVRVIAYGEAATVEFVLNDAIVNRYCDTYTSYLEANGMPLAGSIISEMTVQNPLQKFLNSTQAIQTKLTDFTGKTQTEWVQDGKNSALLVSLLAYDLFCADPAAADVLSYAYGSCYVGIAADNSVHVAVQTPGNTYYFVRSESGTVVSVKTGTNKLSDDQIVDAMKNFTVSWAKLDGMDLLNSVAQQSQTVAEYNAAQSAVN